LPRSLVLSLLLLVSSVSAAAPDDYLARVDAIRKTPGLAAFWDFVKRDAEQRFVPWQSRGDTHDFHLDAVNYVREYWNSGRPATYHDFPLLGRGPFGQAVRFRAEADPDFRPVLLVPRERLHNSALDVKGPGRSVTLLVWLIHEAGNHALAGIWHEGTDLQSAPGGPAHRVERGKRQYALFAGLAANVGAVAAHVSENGGNSFGDKYARNLAVTPDVLPRDAWSVAALSFDDRRHTVTAYLNGKATDFWIDNPAKHPFFQWAARAWARDYRPPERKPLSRKVIEQRGDERIELHVYEFTKVRVTYRQGSKEPVRRELVALRANPYWFPHDLYNPARPEDGGPFTIGRVIHSSRSVGWTGYIGGVTVFNRVLPARDVERLSTIGRTPITHDPKLPNSK
jgi:hypothetical protein